VTPFEPVEREVTRPNRLLTSLGSLSFAVQSAFDAHSLVSSLATHVLDLARADRFALLLFDYQTGELDGESFSQGRPVSARKTRVIPNPGGFLDRVLRHEALVVEDSEAHGASAGEELGWGDQRPRSLIGLPVLVGTSLLGVAVLGYGRPARLTGRRRRSLLFLSDLIGLAVERIRAREELESKSRDLEMARAALRRADEAKSELISVVSHELRTPLTSIKAYTETLMDAVESPSFNMQQKFLGIINEECDRLSRIVNDVLDLSRMESGRTRLKAESIALPRLMEEVIPTVEPELALKRLRLVLDLDRELPVLEADADLMKQVLLNLIANAAKFTRPDTDITVRASRAGDRMVIAVEDRGMGIPEDKLGRVFERFYRVEGVGGERVAGTGLGLAIVKGVVELHGGSIRVESVLGEGSRFVMELPLHQRGFRSLIQSLTPFFERPELRTLLQSCVEMVAEVMEAKIVSFMFFSEDGGELLIQAAYGLDSDTVARTRVRTGDSIAGWVAQNSENLHVPDVESDRRFRKMNHPQYETKSLLCVPLRISGETVGVINANNKVSGAPYDADDLSLLVALAQRVGAAIERARAAGESGDVSAMVAAMRAIIRARRAHLIPSSRRAFRLAADLGRRLKLDAEEIDVLGYVARVHDVGMLSVDTGVRASARRFTESERREIEGHPQAGVQLLRPIELTTRVNAIILAHHEHFDGRGYPRGLRGEEIPLAARILAVLDAFESMTYGRAYRDAVSEADAIQELRRCSGTQFDPRVVEEFIRLLSEQPETAPRPRRSLVSEMNRETLG